MKFTHLILSISGILSGIATTHGQELKRYEGKFTLPLLKCDGNAVYTYKDAEDGTRIFHGNFQFNNAHNVKGYSSYDLSSKNILRQIKGDYYDNDRYLVKAQGQFAENRQVGPWKWEFFTPEGKKLSTITITFDNDGHMDGEAAYTAYDVNDNYSLRFEKGELSGDAIHFVDEDKKGTLKDGHLTGHYEYTYYDTKVEGNYNDDGKPVGVWTETNKSGRKTFAEYNDAGIHQRSYYIDDTTGDRVEGYLGIYPVSFTPWLSKYKDRFRMRDYPDDYIYSRVEQRPSFPGGGSAFSKWLYANEEDSDANSWTYGKVEVQFVVEKDGSITNIQVTKSANDALEKEIVRIVRKMPKWQPGRNNNGIAVRSLYTLSMSLKAPVF